MRIVDKVPGLVIFYGMQTVIFLVTFLISCVVASIYRDWPSICICLLAAALFGLTKWLDTGMEKKTLQAEVKRIEAMIKEQGAAHDALAQKINIRLGMK